MYIDEYIEKQRKEHFPYLNIDKYHEKGFKGQGINILNLESETSEHGEHVCKVIKDVAPNCKIFKGTIGAKCKGGKCVELNIHTSTGKYDLIEFIKTNNIKIINASLGMENLTDKEPTNIYIRENIIDKLGVIFTNSAGNCGSHICGRYKYCAIVVGACWLKDDGTIEKANYSGTGEEIDFNTFCHGLGQQGTSFSAPFLAGQIALLLNKYKDMNQYQVYNLLKDNCKDLGDKGKDNKFGWGLPILPLEEVVKMNFKDIQGHWAEKEIEKAVNSDIVTGYPDGTFKPNESPTRAENCVMYNRLLEKVEIMLKEETNKILKEVK